MLAAEKIVDYVVEAEYGVDPGEGQTTLELEGAGFKGVEGAEHEEHQANSTFPDVTRQTLVARPLTASLIQRLHPATVEALLDMGFLRTAGALGSYTFRQKRSTIEQRKYLGLMVESGEIEIPNKGDVTLSYELVGKSAAAATGITAGSYPAGTPYQGQHTIATVNSVAVSKFISARLRLANNLDQGPVGTSLAISDVVAGFREVTAEIEAVFEAAAWNALVRGTDPFAVVLALYTGVATDNYVVITLGQCRATGSPEEYDGMGARVRETLSVVCEKPAATEAIVYSVEEPA